MAAWTRGGGRVAAWATRCAAHNGSAAAAATPWVAVPARCSSAAAASAAAGVPPPPGHGARGPIHSRVPEGDSKPRLVCDDCGFIAYKNPHVVAGAVCTTRDGRILLARRNIAPRKGFYALPGGYMECEESVAEGAAREVLEEVDARVTVGALLAVYSVPRISQVHIFFRATIDESHVASTTPTGGAVLPGAPSTFYGAGPETMETRLFHEHDIPWQEYAFPSGEAALRFFLRHRADGAVDCRTITRMPGALA